MDLPYLSKLTLAVHCIWKRIGLTLVLPFILLFFHTHKRIAIIIERVLRDAWNYITNWLAYSLSLPLLSHTLILLHFIKDCSDSKCETGGFKIGIKKTHKILLLHCSSPPKVCSLFKIFVCRFYRIYSVSWIPNWKPSIEKYIWPKNRLSIKD